MFPFIRIAGTPQERGLSYGRQATAYIELAIQTYQKSFAERGFAWSEVVRIGRDFACSIRDFDPSMLEELEAIAEGAGRDLGEIVALNARTELLYGVGGRNAGDATELSGEGCTGAIALGTATASGHTLHGQNWDWKEESADFTLVLEIQPAEGPRILTLVEAGTLARCGLNEKGLAVTGNFLKTVEDTGRMGIPAPFIRRKVLMATNLHDAMQAVITSKRSFSINVMISDGAGEAINFETTPERVFWLRPENDLLVHSNHFLSLAAQVAYDDKALHVTPDSLYRDHRVRSALLSRHGSIQALDLKSAFADQYGAPYAVCRSPTDGPGGDGSATLATVVMDVTAGTMSVAKNPYGEHSYQEFSFTAVDADRNVA
ncbi:MAG: C45 family peptidase [Pseudomonadota bacterium]